MHSMWVLLIHHVFVLIFYDSITVRQTLDPYVNDVQYFGSRETTLESNGDLRMSKLGLGKPGDQFLVRSMFECF
jgi:hypothetical protein